jgi:hypothetical protein
MPGDLDDLVGDVEGELMRVAAGVVGGIPQQRSAGVQLPRRADPGPMIDPFDLPDAGVHLGVMAPAQGVEVVEVGGAALGPWHVMVDVAPAHRHRAPRHYAAAVTDGQCGTLGRGGQSDTAADL